MRLAFLAASFIVSSVAFIALPADAQSQSRPITEKERVFVNTLDNLIKNSDKPNNRLMRVISDWGKADDGQLVCTALGMGKSVKEIHKAAIERSFSFPDPLIQEESRAYFAGVLVAATNKLCPEYSQALDKYLESH